MLKPWLTKKEYEAYGYLKEVGHINTTITNLAQILHHDIADLSKRLRALEKKGYIIRNGTYIKVL